MMSHGVACLALSNEEQKFFLLELCDLNGVDLPSFLRTLPSYDTQSKLSKMPDLGDFHIDENFVQSINSKYLNVRDLSELSVNKTDLSLFHINLRSLTAHFDELHTLLGSLKIPFDFIGIIETKQYKDDDFLTNVTIQNYNMYCQSSLSHAGGVALYVKSKKKEDVELRQSDELLCQACPSESLREEIPENQKEEDLKILYVMYENLVEKLKVKRKTVKGKPKIRFRWMGTLDLLKDLVTLILKKSGTWSESRRSSVSFKTSNLTITFYKNTLTLQLQGSQATETSDFLVSLKKTEAKAKNSEIYFEESTSSPAETQGDKTDSDSDTLSVSSEETVPCHTYSTLRKDQTLPSGLKWHQIIILVPHR